MPDDNPAKKSFEAGAKAGREAIDRGSAATEQAARQGEQSYSFAAEGIHEFNAKLFDIAQTNTMAGLNFVAELSRAKWATEAFEIWSRHAQSHFAKAE
jgi:hypothetical protein